MTTYRGVECDQCGTLADGDPLATRLPGWVIVGDDHDRVRVELLPFGTLPLSIKIPRPLVFCCTSCAYAWVARALTDALLRDEANRRLAAYVDEDTLVTSTTESVPW